jgi:predicted transcriptional regulator
MMVNRGRIEIMACILGFCTEPQVKTRIMYRVNITFKQFETYAILLKSQGLLAHEGNRYLATAKGLQFVNAFNQLQNALGGSDFKISSPNRFIKTRQELKMPPPDPFHA